MTDTQPSLARAKLKQTDWIISNTPKRTERKKKENGQTKTEGETEHKKKKENTTVENKTYCPNPDLIPSSPRFDLFQSNPSSCNAHVCRNKPFLVWLTNDQAGVHLGVLLHQVPNDSNGGVVGLSDGEDNFKERVVLAETRGEVLVHVAVDAAEGTDDGNTRDLILGHPRRQ